MVFSSLTHEVLSYLIYSTKVKEQGKSVSINHNLGKEIIMFFKLDRGYISSNSRVADFLCYYYDLKSSKQVLFIIELKGSDTNHAISQLESTINHKKIKNILKNFNSDKKAIIVYTGSAPRNLKKAQEKFKDLGFILVAKYGKNINLRDFL